MVDRGSKVIQRVSIVKCEMDSTCRHTDVRKAHFKRLLDTLSSDISLAQLEGPDRNGRYARACVI